VADALELHVTMPDKDRAASIARVLVDEGLAACVNIVPGVRSIYQWDGKLQEDEVPEILAFAVDDGSATYLEWLKKSTP
jgi:periplasmic divalent cation tolerance protein